MSMKRLGKDHHTNRSHMYYRARVHGRPHIGLLVSDSDMPNVKRTRTLTMKVAVDATLMYCLLMTQFSCLGPAGNENDLKIREKIWLEKKKREGHIQCIMHRILCYLGEVWCPVNITYVLLSQSYKEFDGRLKVSSNGMH